MFKCHNIILLFINTGKNKNGADTPMDGAMPAYLLDRENVTRSKILSNTVKQKRKEKAGKWSVPIPKVRLLLICHRFILQNNIKTLIRQYFMTM